MNEYELGIFADIHGYVAFPFGLEPSKVSAASGDDSRFKVVESEAHESFNIYARQFQARLVFRFGAMIKLGWKEWNPSWRRLISSVWYCLCPMKIRGHH